MARAAKAAAHRRFSKLGTVVGVGVARVAGNYCVKVNLSEPVAPGLDVPTEIEGVPVRVEVTGAIRPR